MTDPQNKFGRIPLTDIEKESLARLGARIRDAREKVGFTLEDVDGKVAWTRWGEIERGKINPTFITLRRICETLGIPMKDMFTGEPFNGDD